MSEAPRMSEPNACFYNPPWYRRALYRLFPSRHIELKDAPPDTVICNHTITQLDWLDRLRILISGKIRLDMRIYCEGKTFVRSTEAVAHIMPPWSDRW